jgi:predicted GIY-YIG superfamily endonuclease
MSFDKYLKQQKSKLIIENDFWSLGKHEIPESPGAYILLANTDFLYPNGKSPIYYIGQTKNLRQRLRTHLKHSLGAQKKLDEREYYLYYPRYEYAAKFGKSYMYMQTWQGKTPKSLEDDLLAYFAKYYFSFPVANSAGSWKKTYVVTEDI